MSGGRRIRFLPEIRIIRMRAFRTRWRAEKFGYLTRKKKMYIRIPIKKTLKKKKTTTNTVHPADPSFGPYYGNNKRSKIARLHNKFREDIGRDDNIVTLTRVNRIKNRANNNVYSSGTRGVSGE